jgi:hypothetical protein
VDISIRADGRACGSTPSWTARRATNLTNPEAPRQTYEKVTGKQVNMISQSWDGKRVYISSLLANWDKAAPTTSSSCAASLGRQGAQEHLRGRLHQGEAGARTT